jgi:hypothetical protein
MLKEQSLVASGACLAQSFGKTIKYPTSDEKVQEFVKQGLQFLFDFRIVW